MTPVTPLCASDGIAGFRIRGLTTTGAAAGFSGLAIRGAGAPVSTFLSGALVAGALVAGRERIGAGVTCRTGPTSCDTPGESEPAKLSSPV
jgi:hypothetical protein